MTGDEERKRLQSSIVWNNTMMIEAAWKDNDALEKHHRDEIQRLRMALNRLDSLNWMSVNFQKEIEGVPV
jgi:quinol monooxygenase YgiN